MAYLIYISISVQRSATQPGAKNANASAAGEDVDELASEDVDGHFLILGASEDLDTENYRYFYLLRDRREFVFWRDMDLESEDGFCRIGGGVYLVVGLDERPLNEWFQSSDEYSCHEIYFNFYISKEKAAAEWKLDTWTKFSEAVDRELRWGSVCEDNFGFSCDWRSPARWTRLLHNPLQDDDTTNALAVIVAVDETELEWRGHHGVTLGANIMETEDAYFVSGSKYIGSFWNSLSGWEPLSYAKGQQWKEICRRSKDGQGSLCAMLWG